MKVYNVTGYVLLLAHALLSALLAPPGWGPLVAAGVGLVYLLLVWFFGGLYLSDIIHMGIAHRALDYRDGFVKAVTLGYNVAGIYINPTTWVNRHRHHHAYSDGPGDPNKLAADGFWKTMYLIVFPYPCQSELTRDPVFRSRTFRLVSNPYFAVFSQASSYGLLWLAVGDWKYALFLWSSVRVFALYINMIQNYWTHDRRWGTRRYDDADDNAMNIGDWLPVTLSFSASLQNNHHHHDRFLRLSHEEGEYDFGFLTVRVMKALGLVKPSATGAQKPAGIPLREIGL